MPTHGSLTKAGRIRFAASGEHKPRPNHVTYNNTLRTKHGNASIFHPENMGPRMANRKAYERMKREEAAKSGTVRRRVEAKRR